MIADFRFRIPIWSVALGNSCGYAGDFALREMAGAYEVAIFFIITILPGVKLRVTVSDIGPRVCHDNL